MHNGKRSDPDPMCLFCDGSGFMRVADEPERLAAGLAIPTCNAVPTRPATGARAG